MRNILAISSYKIFPAHSGGQKGIAYFYKHFTKEENVVLIGTKNNDLSNTYGIAVKSVFGTSAARYANLFCYFELKKIILQKKIDVVIVEQPYMGIFGIMLQKFLRKKLVIHSHNIEGLRFKDLGKWWWKPLLMYEKFVHRTADFSFFITEEDRMYAIKNFRLKENKTAAITYGTDIEYSYNIEQKTGFTESLKRKFGIPLEQTLLLFNGAFGYEPNDKALELLLNEIMPALLKRDKNFTLLICGKNIPAGFNKYQSENIIIKGFVDDINEVFKGAEIFLNPIWLGGGIKTKLVEALSFGACGVSFRSGAIGIPEEIIGKKLSFVDDENVARFVEAIIQQKRNVHSVTPDSFYWHFYWGNIAKKASSMISKL